MMSVDCVTSMNILFLNVSQCFLSHNLSLHLGAATQPHHPDHSPHQIVNRQINQ